MLFTLLLVHVLRASPTPGPSLHLRSSPAVTLSAFDFRVVLCDTWNRNDDNDTVSGIAILDTTAIPEMRYAISSFFRNRQSHTLVITEMCVCSSVSTVCTLARPVVYVDTLGGLMSLITCFYITKHEVRACVSKHSKKPSCR